VTVGQHQRRYVISSHCASESDCQLSAVTYDSATGKKLGSIAFKWDGSTYRYRGPASWYSHEGGSSCEDSSGNVIANAYVTHEEVHVSPQTTADGEAVTMKGTKTISGTPTAAGAAAGCSAFEMNYTVSMSAQ
jgi:hypothetical protein